ncbi:MAG: TIGR01212 family radical SAM protein [Spirochaetes bacterium]|nr:MAG: TIGR01212 family radical SAM protein [Spirochaetota bacterium]
MTVRSEHGGREGKPYNFFGDYLLKKFGCRVLKLPIDARLTCPNRDGTLDTRGCVFCGEDGSASPTSAGTEDIHLQMRTARESFRRAGADTLYIAYFQAFTNTYAPVDVLKRLYDAALGEPGVTGLMIATRPDCVPDETLDLIAGYAREGFELWLELGMQSAHDKSLETLGRRHTNADTVDAVSRAALRGIPVCTHLILGIPGESWKDIMDTAALVSSLPVRGVKLHHLHVIRGTQLEKAFREGKFSPLGLEEYVSSACDFLERLRPDIIIHRLIGDRPPATLVAPLWALHKGTVLRAIEEELMRRGSFQGMLCS